LDEDSILRRILKGPEVEPAGNSLSRRAHSEEISDESKEENKHEQFDEQRYKEEDKMADRWNAPQLGKLRWVDDIRSALLEEGGEADLAVIYRVAERIRKDGGRSTPRSLDATVRQSIEAHCPTSGNYREGNGKYFEHVGRGRYRLIR